LQRIKTRGDRANHFEKTGTLRKAREIFLSIKKPYLLKLDALESPELLREKILQRFHEILATRKEAQAAKKASQTEATVKKAGNR
jgi:thymidylate kinase